MTQYSVIELVNKIPQRFVPEAATGIQATFQFMIDDAEDFFITVDDATCECQLGEHDDPNVTLLTNMETVHDVLNGKVGGMSAFLQGKLKAEGNVRLATNLSKYFKKQS